MEGNSAYDYACCERVWRKVAPTENPYPNARAEAEKNTSDGGQPQNSGLSLAGAQRDPCCMGTAAAESLEVLEGFVREELAAKQMYLCFSRCAPARETRRLFYAMACDEERHARQLTAAIYLATGEIYCPRVCAEQTCSEGYCACLRRFYHEEACSGYNYFRAGEETLDYCLEQMFTDMSKDEYRHARQILRLLSRALKT